MKILIDTNVALDILLNRRDYTNAVAVFDMAENKHITGYISASAITDIFYIAQKDIGKKTCERSYKEQFIRAVTVTED
jgi:predicted nucleic acid-binding protein